MNINRYNYEEFFLLYVDNELTKAERLEVEAFVDANADLEEELVMLKQARLRPDASVQFAGKELLMKPETSGSFISEANYEEFFLLYIDNELGSVARKEVEEFAAARPALQQELNLLLQAKAEPDHSVVFPDKSLLYKQPEIGRRPVIAAWWRVTAVAAMLLIAFGIFWLNQTGTTKPDVARVGPDQTGQSDKTAKSGQTDKAGQADKNGQDGQVAQTDKQPEGKTQNALPDQNNVESKDLGQNNQLANRQSNDKQPATSVKKQQQPVVKENQDLAYNQPSRTAVSDAQDKLLEQANIARLQGNTANTNISTGVENAHRASAVQVSQPMVTYAVNTASAGLPEVDEDESFGPIPVKKNKLRGLFRKVSRVFEKTTNLPAVEEKGILIGNFEIALK